MATLVQAAKSNDKVCVGHYCRMSPGNMDHLQDVLQSNRIVHFEKGDYHITSSSGSGFILVQDVVNLTIIGHGVESQIFCSPNATFGFHFNNVSNLTISGLSISNCSIPVRNVSASILANDSKNVAFLNVSIRSSPGFALIAMKTSLPKLTGLGDDDGSYLSYMPIDIIVEDCNMSLNKQGSLLLYRTSALLKKTVFINNNVLQSLSSELSLRDVYFFSSPMILMQTKKALMTGNVEFHQSPTHIIESGLIIKDSSVVFSNIKGPNLTTMVTVLKSSLNITSNAFIVFKEHVFSHSSLKVFSIKKSNICIQDGAKLLFANNTVSDGSIILLYIAHDSHITIKGSTSTIVFEQNVASNGSIIMYGISGNWNIMNNTCVIFQGNAAHDNANIVSFNMLNFTIAENASITFNNNKVSRNAKISFR